MGVFAMALSSLICLSVCFTTTSLIAQVTPPPSDSASTNQTTAAATSSPTKSPFDFTFGPQKDGGFGTTLKGSKYYSLSNIGPNSPASTRSVLVSPFAGVAVDAGWSSVANAANNASLSFRPSLGISSVIASAKGGPPTMRGPWLHAYIDVRERYGNFKQKDSSLQRISQTIGGIGTELRMVWFDDWLNLSQRTGKIDEAPRLSVAYYTIRGTSVEKAALPDELKANVIQLELKNSTTIPGLQCTKKTVQSTDPNDIFGSGTSITCPWSLSVDLLGTRPTTGSDRKNELLTDLALSFETGGNLKPVLHYRSGKEHGLEYDRQLILGILMKLFQ